MSEPHFARPRRGGDAHNSVPGPRRSLFQRLIELLAPGPDSRDELMESLADAESKALIAPESRMMLEGVIRMADMTAGDGVTDGKISQGAGMNGVQFSLCSCKLIVHAGCGNSFLYRFFALLGTQFAELDSGVGRDGRQQV